MDSGIDKDGIIRIKPEFSFGDMVFLRADPEYIGIVASYILLPGFTIKYGVKWPSNYETHYAFELETLLIEPT